MINREITNITYKLTSIKILEKEYDRFENAQNTAKITAFGPKTQARTHGLYYNVHFQIYHILSPIF